MSTILITYIIDWSANWSNIYRFIVLLLWWTFIYITHFQCSKCIISILGLYYSWCNRITKVYLLLNKILKIFMASLSLYIWSFCGSGIMSALLRPSYDYSLSLRRLGIISLTYSIEFICCYYISHYTFFLRFFWCPIVNIKIWNRILSIIWCTF
jgi:hypothetical protein